jgi:UDP-N-acetylmuramoyl-tripeptide--D-alanyl-D-alanine ligase
MKTLFKKIIISTLEWEAKLVLKKYKPKIIAITGSVGKTSTKDAIYSVLCKSFLLRKS